MNETSESVIPETVKVISNYSVVHKTIICMPDSEIFTVSMN